MSENPFGNAAMKTKVSSFNPGTYHSTASNIMCVYADQGEGKTCLILDAPSEWKIYVSDIDGGFESAATLWSRDPSLLCVKTAESFRDFHAAVWNAPDSFQLYVLDTYTLGTNRIKKHVEKQMGISPDELIDWWKVGGKISAMAMTYFDQWCEIVKRNNAWGLVLCQEKTEGDDNPKCVPDLVGQCRRHVAGVSNYVFHLEKHLLVKDGRRSYERVLRTKDSPGVMAKDRSNALLELEPAHLANIIAKIEAAREERRGRQEQRQATTEAQEETNG